MIVFDKTEIRELLKPEDIYNLLIEWGGEPEYTSFGFISATICHNKPGEGSRKLYYYSNSDLFHCYTQCEDQNFDIFQLVIKVMEIQHHTNYDLNDAVRWIAQKFGIAGHYENDEGTDLEDWKYLDNYNRIQEINIETNFITLKKYDNEILNNFNYEVKLIPWLNEGITQEVIDFNRIGFYPGGDQITIPHYDIDGNFIGLRGRAMCQEEAAMYGKYRPLKINKVLYNHPLGTNLYNLNNSKDNISLMGKAIVFESEKSTLKYQSFFGIENDISVACCGSSISNYQIQLLLSLDVDEIIVAFDRQFQSIGDDEFKKLKIKLLNLYHKYKNYVNISFIFDKNMITGYKDSPIDIDKNIFLQLFKERIVL